VAPPDASLQAGETVAISQPLCVWWMERGYKGKHPLQAMETALLCCKVKISFSTKGNPERKMRICLQTRATCQGI
jgi:hypothetical protein